MLPRGHRLTPPSSAATCGTYVRDGLLLDITDQLELDPLLGAGNYFIQPQEYDRCTFEDRWYGIGSCWVAPHRYYNAATFEAAGIEPPSNDPDEAWTWDQFVEAARALTMDANGNHPGDAGFDVDNVEQWGVHWMLPAGAAALHPVDLRRAGRREQFLDPESHLLVSGQNDGAPGNPEPGRSYAGPSKSCRSRRPWRISA
ncbi:MAG: extracellular solute-binding protein [Caldilineaceae bacterium]